MQGQRTPGAIASARASGDGAMSASTVPSPVADRGGVASGDGAMGVSTVPSPVADRGRVGAGVGRATGAVESLARRLESRVGREEEGHPGEFEGGPGPLGEGGVPVRAIGGSGGGTACASHCAYPRHPRPPVATPAKPDAPAGLRGNPRSSPSTPQFGLPRYASSVPRRHRQEGRAEEREDGGRGGEGERGRAQLVPSLIEEEGRVGGESRTAPAISATPGRARVGKPATRHSTVAGGQR